MRSRPAFFVAVAVACAAGCGGPSLRVETSAEPGLGAVRTYAWHPGEGEIVGVYESRRDLARDVARQEVEAGLKRNGIVPAPAEAPADVFVRYLLGVRSRREIDSYKTVQRNGEAIAVPSEVTIYRAGTVLVYLVDPRTNSVVWVGSASGEAEATEKDSAARARLSRAIRALFDEMKKDKGRSRSASRDAARPHTLAVGG